MKIGIISDIHMDKNKDYPILEALTHAIRSKGLCCLVIAGDVSDRHSVTLKFINELSARSGRPVYFVPGNHDIWDKEGEWGDARVLYGELRRHPFCLVDSPVLLGEDWVLLGDIGWYDYSFGNPKFSYADFDKKFMYNQAWLTGTYSDWHKADTVIHREMLDRLEKQIVCFKEKNKKIIAVTHMVTDEYFTVPESREKWDYFNAFLGSADYGALYEKYGVEYSVMGHVHYRKRLEKNGVAYLCSCLNTYNEWQSADFEAEINDALTVLDLGNA